MLPGGLARVLYGARDIVVRWLTGIDPRPDVERAPAAAFDTIGELAGRPGR
jgi:hypothetical protein